MAQANHSWRQCRLQLTVSGLIGNNDGLYLFPVAVLMPTIQTLVNSGRLSVMTSISSGNTFKPLLSTMVNFSRPWICSRPSVILPMSPVLNQPSFGKCGCGRGIVVPVFPKDIRPSRLDLVGIFATRTCILLSILPCESRRRSFGLLTARTGDVSVRP